MEEYVCQKDLLWFHAHYVICSLLDWLALPAIPFLLKTPSRQANVPRLPMKSSQLLRSL